MNLVGFFSIVPSILTIIGIWAVILVVARIIKSALFRSLEKLDDEEEILKSKELISKIMSLVDIWATALAITSIIIFVVFLSNPMERAHIKTITPAQVDSNYKEVPRQEIEKSNKLAITKKSEEKKQEAVKDNDKAMEEAGKLFQQFINNK